MYIIELGTDIIKEIHSYLPIWDIVRFSVSCRTLYSILGHYYPHLLRRDYNISEEDEDLAMGIYQQYHLHSLFLLRLNKYRYNSSTHSVITWSHIYNFYRNRAFVNFIDDTSKALYTLDILNLEERGKSFSMLKKLIFDNPIDISVKLDAYIILSLVHVNIGQHVSYFKLRNQREDIFYVSCYNLYIFLFHTIMKAYVKGIDIEEQDKSIKTIGDMLEEDIERLTQECFYMLYV